MAVFADCPNVDDAPISMGPDPPSPRIIGYEKKKSEEGSPLWSCRIFSRDIRPDAGGAMRFTDRGCGSLRACQIEPLDGRGIQR